MPEKNGKERRRKERFSISLDVTCEFIRHEKVEKGKTGDITDEGVRVFSDGESAAGDVLRLTIDMGERTLVAEGTVVWVWPTEELGLDVGHKYAMGLQFSKIADEDTVMIGEFIQDALLGGN